jgi:hypothetical protein
MVEGPLFLLVIYAVLPIKMLQKLFDRRRAGISSISTISATLSVTRGEQSWKYVGQFYLAFSAVVFAIPMFVESAKPYRIILSLANLTAALYLCFRNKWFRRTIIGLFGRTMNAPD